MTEKKTLIETMFGELYAIRQKAQRVEYPEIAALCVGIADALRRCEHPLSGKEVADCARDAVEKQMQLFNYIQDQIVNTTLNSSDAAPVIDMLSEFDRRLSNLQHAFFPYLHHIEGLMAGDAPTRKKSEPMRKKTDAMRLQQDAPRKKQMPPASIRTRPERKRAL